MKYFRKIQVALVRAFFVAIAIVLGSTSILYSASEPPYTFSPGQTISSAQVNANFQALSTQIATLQTQLATLQTQLAPVSIVGTYDYFAFGTGMEIVSFGATEYLFNSTQSSYRGTLVFDASGTVTFNGTGGYVKMEIRNEIADVDMTGRTDMRSLISGTYSNDYPTDIGTGSYTLSGSTITVAGGFVGTLSKDGKIIVGRMADSNSAGIMIAIRRQ